MMYQFKNKNSDQDVILSVEYSNGDTLSVLLAPNEQTPAEWFTDNVLKLKHRLPSLSIVTVRKEGD